MKKMFFWVQRFFTVYGIIMLSTFFMCLLANPTSQLPVVRFFGRCIVLTLVCLLSLAVYYSRKADHPRVVAAHGPAYPAAGGGAAPVGASLGILVWTAGRGDLCVLYSGGKGGLASDRLYPQRTGSDPGK